MLRLRHLLGCVRRPRAVDPGALVLHEPTGTYLGEGCWLTAREGAVSFDSVEAAEAFLSRHGSEPCLVPVALVDAALDTAA